jgi:POT family proton-dependent oligopeptide transporter
MAAINLGALVGPLLCGLLAELYGWHYGFGVAAIVMLLGLLTYLYGFRYLLAKVERERHEAGPLTAREWVAVSALITVIAITTFQSVALYQIFNAMVIWIQQYVSLNVDGFHIPVPWYQSLNAVGGILVVPLLYWIWRLQARRGHEPDDLAKIGTGAWITAASYVILLAPIALSQGAKISPVWPALSILGSGIAWVYQWPILFALVSRAAPTKLKGTMMGVAYLSLFASAILVGWIGGFYEKMSPAQFWAMHAAIAATGGLLILLFGRQLGRVLQAT